MAQGVSSPMGILSILLIIIGVVMAVVGIILLLVNQGKSKPFYIWVLIIAGTVMGIAGGVLLAIVLSQVPKPIIEETTEEKYLINLDKQSIITEEKPVITEQKEVIRVGALH